MNQGLWPCNCEGLQFSSKSYIICLVDMVWWNLYWAYFLEIGMIQISKNHEIFFYDLSCRIFHDNSFGSLGLHLLLWSELGKWQPFRPMRDLRMQCSSVFNLVHEVALRSDDRCKVICDNRPYHELRPRYSWSMIVLGYNWENKLSLFNSLLIWLLWSYCYKVGGKSTYDHRFVTNTSQ